MTEDPREPYRQADPRWGACEIAPVQPGARPANLARKGCLITSVAEVSRRYGDLALDPPTVLQRGKKAGAFYGANAVLPVLADAAGLKAPREERVFAANGIDEMRRVLRAALVNGFAVLHVDHDAQGAGDHFVVAVRIESDSDGGHVVYSDPATGKEARLSLSTLEGRAGWPVAAPKTYRVVSVAPIYAPNRTRPKLT